MWLAALALATLSQAELDLERVSSGREYAQLEFEERFQFHEVLEAARRAEAARAGVWAEQRDAFPWDPDSRRRRVPAQIRGVALPMHSRDAQYDYERELTEIAGLGAKWVSLQLVTMQERVDSSEVPLTSERTPTEARLRATIGRARELGLDVLLLPIVLIRNPGPEDWRGTLAPVDRNAWWESYARYILHIVSIAADEGAGAVALGSELATLERDEERWKWLIANARLRYAGLLTYSANWDHFDRVRFWRELDFAGMTAYFELSDAPEPTVEQLTEGWRHGFAEMQRLARLSHAPVLLTEVGMPSLKGAAGSPWDYTARGEVDLGMQARSFEAFGKLFTKEEPTFLGMLLYDWWGYGGAEDTGYTAREKPAEAIWRELLLD